MYEILRRELERYVRANKLIPGNPSGTAPVSLVCIPRNKQNPQVKEFRKYFNKNYQLESTMSLTELANQVEMEFSIRMV